MTDAFSRRDWIKTIGAFGAGAFVPFDAIALPRAPIADPRVTPPRANGEIQPLMNTSEVFIPPRGRANMKFSFDFPEPVVTFDDYRFGFIIFTDENTYALDPAKMKAEVSGDTMKLTCTGFTWAGGQEKVPGSLTANFRKIGDVIEWDAVAEHAHPIKTISAVIRGIPRGGLSLGAGNVTPPNDGETLAGYPFNAGDLHGGQTPQGMNTPLAVVQVSDQDFRYLTTMDDRVRPKRFYFQPGDTAFRVEAIYEHDGWRNDKRVTMPAWRLGKATTLDAAIQPHMDHLERAYKIPSWDTRDDVPSWLRQIAMVTTLHGMHYTGFMFNDYAQQLEILRWIATQMPASRVLVFLAAWDGRYYWDYPNYKVSDRMGGDAGFRQLIGEAQKLGFKMMPMYGTNAANRKQPAWSQISSGRTEKIDGDIYNLNWVDWNNDRHQDGWLTYMNLGADSWRNWLTARVSDMVERYNIDAYFLDIVGGHVNSTTGDMHEGTRRFVTDLRAKYPKVVCVGEMSYDALHAFIPYYQVGLGPRFSKYSRSFSHLSSPAPGRGSSGVHESGFGRFNDQTLGLSNATVPTLQVVDDTFTKHRDVMAAIIQNAKERAGLI